MARILILEDAPDLADLYQLTLEGEGHEVVGIHDDPKKAIALSAEGSAMPEPDLIILDERLAGLSGTEHLRELKRAFPEARVLVATADGDAAARAVSEGADGARQKPFMLDDLLQDIRRLLEPLGKS